MPRGVSEEEALLFTETFKSLLETNYLALRKSTVVFL